MSSLRGGQRKDNSGRTGTCDRDILLDFCRRKLFWEDVFEAGPWVDGALRMASQNEFIDAAFLASDTGAYFVHFSAVCLFTPVCVAEKGSCQHYHVAVSVSKGFFRKIRIAELTDRNNRNFFSGI